MNRVNFLPLLGKNIQTEIDWKLNMIKEGMMKKPPIHCCGIEQVSPKKIFHTKLRLPLLQMQFFFRSINTRGNSEMQTMKTVSIPSKKILVDFVENDFLFVDLLLEV